MVSSSFGFVRSSIIDYSYSTSYSRGAETANGNDIPCREFLRVARLTAQRGGIHAKI